MKGRRFTAEEASLLQDIILNRRDVRGNRFHSDPIPEPALQQILEAGVNAPSVGFSQPWEFVLVKDATRRQAIRDSFYQENSKAGDLFFGPRAELYQRLKLEGIVESPLNIAVFYRPPEQAVLGQTSMDEVGRYSVVCAIQNMWLMARSLNIGMGWVSILDPVEVRSILQVPEDRELVGYLCLGYVDEFYEAPELERLQWERRRAMQSLVHHEIFQTGE
ncbi:MAG: 5,6-dimethylbenzimidazole synthase [Pseudomonadales bacterium]|nr:5,6-dimethylbenzimidazole synthase [Pseudomonadales bacterium]